MRRVEIKAGVYGRRDEKGRVRPVSKGEQVELPDEEAARLVALEVAAYAEGPAAAPAVPADGRGTAGRSSDTTGSAPPAEDAPDGGEAAPDNAEVARLERMQKSDLEAMARDMGLDVGQAKTKHDLAVLIAAADGQEDGEAPPELGTGDIVQ